MTTTFRVDFKEVAANADMHKVLALLDIAVAKTDGAQLRCKCALCGEPRGMSLNTEIKRWRCFKCPERGDAIALVSKVRKISNLEAAKLIIGDTVPQERVSTVPQAQDAKKHSGFDAAAYARGLDALHASLAPLDLSPEILKEFSAGYASSGRQRGRLAIGLKDRDGELVGFVGMALNGESPRMLPPTDKFDMNQFVFGVDRITQSEVRRVADPLEVISCAQDGEQTFCFLTDVVEAGQHELLAVHQHEKGFKVFYPRE